MDIAELIKINRKKMELSYRELAEKTGISHTYIRDVENNKYAPSLENAQKLATELGLDMKEIIVLTFQAQTRLTMIEMMSACYKYNIKIPYDLWLKAGLPLQSLNQEDTNVHDAIMNVAVSLMSTENAHGLASQSSLLNELMAIEHNDSTTSALLNFFFYVQIVSKRKGPEHILARVNELLNEEGLIKEEK
ncbi:transcriptional regulator with XRE-family HTH domain [Fontibacillus solani]|uniref:Transcriptional regulator with XRE-family HTH domain n=1 Tax=Fontibacillus solani TaxID=1572857 RepID=A0A7W3XRS3_9BACL|nr:helix-turn-helix transcriptional regulator [Fontibacillus solani]MBA9085967.1 transcriptional regulator with XRE-family HTH domain [Fontibacillus solani]